MKVEPGSNGSVTARFRHWSPVAIWYAFGLKVGRIAIARSSPVRGSMMRTIPALAPVERQAASSSRSARYWIVASIVRTRPGLASAPSRIVGCRGHLAAEGVPLHQRHPRLAGERLVVSALDSLEALVVPPDEPEHLGGQLAARIEPERLRERPDPGQAGSADGLGRRRR